MTTVYEVAEDLVQYFIEHWDDYIADIFCAMYPNECRKHNRVGATMLKVMLHFLIGLYVRKSLE
jgi:hypothetical protein